MLQSFAFIFILGILLGKIAEKLNLPALIGYLLSGIILGPFVLNLIDSQTINLASDIQEIALLIILIQAGLSLELSDFKKMGFKAVLFSFVPACFEIAATFFLAQTFLGMAPQTALLLGVIIASASPAVIIPRMLKLMKEGYGTKKGIPQLILAGDSIDDVFNIVLFSSILGMQSGEALNFMDFLSVPISIIAGIVLGAIIGYILTYIFKYLENQVELKTIVFLATGFALISISDIISTVFPFSGLISIMAAGVTLLKLLPNDADQITDNLASLWIGAQILLFSFVGLTVNLGAAKEAGIIVIVMLVLALIIRGIGITICLIGSDYNLKEKLFCTLTGIPKATVQAAIGGIPLAMGIEGGEIILAISVIAILFTAPLGAILIDSSYKKLLTKDI